MCLITNQAKPVRLRKDKTVWKVLERVLTGEGGYSTTRYAPIYRKGIYYMRGVTMRTEMLENGDTLGFDTAANIRIDRVLDWVVNYPAKGWLNDNDRRRKAIKDGAIKSIGDGFHFATTKSRLDEVAGDCRNESVVVMRFVVPKGSLVYYDVGGLGVCDTIMMAED